MTIKAIETKYKGYRFRSRTEARWAIFFDHMSLSWLYEHEGYSLPSGPYLPDFFFPDLNIFVEIKGVRPKWDQLELNLCRELCKHSEREVFVLFGEFSPLACEMDGRVHGCSGIGFYPKLEGSFRRGWPSTSELCHEDDGCCEWGECPLCNKVGLHFHGGIECDCKCTGRFIAWRDGRYICEVCGRLEGTGVPHFEKGWHEPYKDSRSDRILKAYEAAKSARFEHGESP